MALTSSQMRNNQDLNSLTDKVALITGATSGIGAQQARALSNAGASVVLVGRREDRLKELAEEIRNSGGEADYLAADLSDEGQWDIVVKASLSFFGRVDILCNTALISVNMQMMLPQKAGI